MNPIKCNKRTNTVEIENKVVEKIVEKIVEKVVYKDRIKEVPVNKVVPCKSRSCQTDVIETPEKPLELKEYKQIVIDTVSFDDEDQDIPNFGGFNIH